MLSLLSLLHQQPRHAPFQRKQVTEFKFCIKNIALTQIKLKTHDDISQTNLEADSQTHYVCQYCRPILNRNNMPCICILNGLITEPVPKVLQVLNPLSKQLIQRGKAFQVIFRLGIHTQARFPITIPLRHVREQCSSCLCPLRRRYKPLTKCTATNQVRAWPAYPTPSIISLSMASLQRIRSCGSQSRESCS